MNARERSFGLTVGAALGVIAALLAWRGRIVRAEILGAISAVLLVAGALMPALLRKPSAWWWRFSHVLGAFNARVMLTVLYAVAFVPLGVFWRMTGKDPLTRRRDKWIGWAPHAARYRDPKHYERMF